jgi:hypothetical protein
MEEICDTPAEILAGRDPADACVEEPWQAVGGKGADFRNQLDLFLIKTNVFVNFAIF